MVSWTYIYCRCTTRWWEKYSHTYMNPEMTLSCKSCRFACTVECRYNAMQYNTIIHTSLQWPMQNPNQGLHSQKTLHTSPSWASYGVYIVNIFEQTDRVITALHRTWYCVEWIFSHIDSSGPWFNIKMSSYQCRKSHCGDKTILRPSYLHNGISYTGKMISLYWIRIQVSVDVKDLSSFHGVAVASR